MTALASRLLAEVRGAVARGWCAPANSTKVMDTDLAEAIAQEVCALMQAEAAAALSGGEAVATVCLRGETYAHGLMTELQVQHAEGVEFPIGTKFYTTPQPGETP